MPTTFPVYLSCKMCFFVIKTNGKFRKSINHSSDYFENSFLGPKTVSLMLNRTKICNGYSDDDTGHKNIGCQAHLRLHKGDEVFIAGIYNFTLNLNLRNHLRWQIFMALTKLSVLEQPDIENWENNRLRELIDTGPRCFVTSSLQQKIS